MQSANLALSGCHKVLTLNKEIEVIHTGFYFIRTTGGKNISGSQFVRE
jgi:hypothetical protein